MTESDVASLALGAAMVLFLIAVIARLAINASHSDVHVTGNVRHSGTIRHEGTVQHEMTGSVHHTFDAVRHVVELNQADRLLLERLVTQREPLSPSQTVELRRLTAARALYSNHRGELS